MKLRVAQFGLGPIGIETVKLTHTKAWADIVGAIDLDPAKGEKDLGELTGLRNLGKRRVFRSLEELLAQEKPDLIFHTTVSQFHRAYTQIEPIVRQGINVVSSCEELVFPQLREPRLARKLNRLCEQHGARVFGTGVNPGFVMDLLPLCLTGVNCAVREVHVQRVVNASTRRGPLQKKIGSGLPPAQFRRTLRAGEAGHAGLRESLALIAHGLGWKLDSIRETAEPMVADHPIHTQHFDVRRGQTCGIHQRAVGRIKGRACLSLDIQMYLDAPDPHDAIQIRGEPPLNAIIQGGVAGDQATVAALVNSAPRLMRAAPGLRLATELAVPRLA